VPECLQAGWFLQQTVPAANRTEAAKARMSDTYASTLKLSVDGLRHQQLADWSDEIKADAFAEWRGKKIGL
jgi:hypothetical protein